MKPELLRRLRDLEDEDEEPRVRRKRLREFTGAADERGPFYAELSDDFVAALPCPTKELQVFDAMVPRLSVRVRVTGSKAFYVSYPSTRRTQKARQQLGTFPELSVDEARHCAVAHLKMAAKGERPSRRSAGARPKTVEAAIAHYCETIVPRLSPNHARRTRSLLADFERRHGKTSVSTLRRSTLTAFIQHAAALTPSRGHDLHKTVKAWLSWCAREGIIDTNPLGGVAPMPRPASPPVVLTVKELAKIFDASQKLDVPAAALVQLVMLTGQPVERIRHLHRTQVDLPRSRWVPEPLAPWADVTRWTPLPLVCRAILERLPPSKEYVFSAARRSEHPGYRQMRPLHLSATTLKRLQERSGVDGWTWKHLVARCASQRREVAGRVGEDCATDQWACLMKQEFSKIHSDDDLEL